MPANRKDEFASGIDPADLKVIRAEAFQNLDKFIQSQFQVLDKDSGETKPFQYNWTQRYIARRIEHLSKDRNPLRVFILKSRQVGMTTWTSARMAAKAWSSDKRKCVVVAHRDDRAKEILERCKEFLDGMDPDLKLDYDRQGKEQLRIGSTKSSIHVATARQIQKVRGETARDGIESEAALYQNFGNVHAELESVIPRSSWDTSLIIETTGFNFNGECHQFWKQTGRMPERRDGRIIKPGRTGKNRYFGIFISWLEDPTATYYHIDNNGKLKYGFRSPKERDMLVEQALSHDERLGIEAKKHGWTSGQLVYAFFILRDVLHNNWDKFKEDFPCTEEEAWQSKAKTFFGKDTMAAFQPRNYEYQLRSFEGRNLHQQFSHIDDLMKVDSFDMNGSRPYLKVWKDCMPSPGTEYVIGADVSGGEMDSTFASAFVIDTLTREMCAEFHGRVRPDEFAYILCSLGNMYNNAVVAPEYNNHGYALCQELAKIYFNIYRWRMQDNYKLKMTNKMGWQTNSWSRPYMLDVFRRLCEEIARENMADPGIIKSVELLDEMSTFVDTEFEGRPEALNGSFDDRVMALSIAHVVASQETHGGQHDISRIISEKQEAYREQAFLGSQATDSYGRTMSPTQSIAFLSGNGKAVLDESEANAKRFIEQFWRK